MELNKVSKVATSRILIRNRLNRQGVKNAKIVFALLSSRRTTLPPWRRPTGTRNGTDEVVRVGPAGHL